MKTNFDQQKSKMEKLLDKTIAALERTYPEQRTDAMEDYAGVLRLLSPISEDYRIKPIIDILKRLYVYPNRPEHNELLLEVHDLKEMLHEDRISNILSAKDVGRKSLGDSSKPKNWPWLLVSAIALLILRT